jgi:large subunit ribosomal protein L31
MKKNAHPNYQKVLFVDSASGFRFVCGSTLKPDGKEKFEGVEYPVSYLSISSASHPFFTGSKQLVDSEGRVEKFKKRFGGKGSTHQEQQAKEQSQSQDKQQDSAQEKKAAPVKAESKAPAAKATNKAPAAKAPAKAPAAKAPAKAAAKKK